MSFNNTKSDCPCKGCVSRVVGCHSTCILYIDWKQVNDVKRELKYKEAQLKNLCYESGLKRDSQLKQRGLNFGRNKRSNGSR